MSEILFAILLGHFIADYWFQSSKIIDLKTSKKLKERHWGLLCHIFIHFITYISLLVIIRKLTLADLKSTGLMLIVILLITIIHYLIDLGKVWLQTSEFQEKYNNKMINWFISRVNMKETVLGKAFLYALDQLLHIIVIIIVLFCFNFINYTLDNGINFISDLFFEDPLNLSNLDKFLLISSLIIFTTHFYGYLIGIFLIKIKPSNSSFTESRTENKNIKTTKVDNKKKEKVEEESVIEEISIQNKYAEPDFEVGKYIGMIERIIIMILVAMNAFTGITFLVAIKALTRFKQFDDKRFAEYYLVGNLLSMLLGISSGYLLLQIIN